MRKYNMMVADQDLMRWKHCADEERITLSEWIRGACLIRETQGLSRRRRDKGSAQANAEAANAPTRESRGLPSFEETMTELDDVLRDRK